MSAANQVSLPLGETARRAIVRLKPPSDGEGFRGQASRICLLLRRFERNFVRFIAAVLIIGGNIAELLRTDIIAASIAASAIAGFVAFQEAITDGFGKRNADAIFRAFFVCFTIISQTIAAR
jgi:hypothetical protein